MPHSSFFADGVTIPFDFGLPQFILLLVGLLGVGLLLWVVLGMTRGKPGLEKGTRIRRFYYGRFISGVVLLFLAVSLIYLAILLQTYFSLTSKLLVARVSAAPIANAGALPKMSVHIKLFDKNGGQTSDNTYEICGDYWRLEGDIVKFADWTAFLGLHTGYKLTRLEGEYANPNLERTAQHCLQELNGGDDDFFKTLQNQGGWFKPLVEVSFGGAIILPSDGKTYNIYIAQTGLVPGSPQPTLAPLVQVALAPPALALATRRPGA